jgi:hypothetical protein
MKRASLSIAMVLSACSQTVDAPSLAPRAVEAPDSPPAAAVAPIVDPADDARIAMWLDRARRADVAFERALPAASVSAPQGSDAWILAQNARSALDVTRGPTRDAITALDTAIGDALDKGRETGALVAARAEIQSIYDRQTAKLDAISR